VVAERTFAFFITTQARSHSRQVAVVGTHQLRTFLSDL